MSKAGANPKNAREGFLFTVDGEQFILSLKDAVYASLAGVLGMTKVTGDPPEGARQITLDEAIDDNLVIFMNVTYSVGKNPVTGKLKTQQGGIVIPRDNVNTALKPTTGLASKSYRGKAISRVRQPRKRKFSYA
ncbi:hypothetical protein Lepto7376_3133 [[Leptolyngbya] sp. PCC 7376]|uniref:hypothetical protein n=1 Tax=[Leptolyngbya] sp. PCC 7376 TaxID=111781 RepID=UPI00029F46EC|nr:hypothetical protein [[Leptolyngbya] sp. PCC 7376]AFY39370.1 hypothetical protein Lepto7376_3133 [[Leptolyngbya] sp. PCC 7376]